MKKEVKMLLKKATDSLILSIELFNRPQEQCRHTGALIMLDYSFEILLKAAILQRRGRIRNKKYDHNTIGFDACLRIAVSNGDIKFLTEEQVSYKWFKRCCSTLYFADFGATVVCAYAIGGNPVLGYS